MYKKILFLLVFSVSVYAQEYKQRTAELEFFATQGDSLVALKTPNKLSVPSKLPYPIIFIHGLNSSSETWNTTTTYLDSQYNFTFGGRFDFCLNYDGNDATANKNMYPVSGADIAAFETTTMQAGDYYYVNFDVGLNGAVAPSGANYVMSNLSAIAKQGVAVKKAVERVLQLTGKDKVILVGHSMGGLASREYIQNATLWQSDSKHHVAKLLTLGTPHGGSNASDSFLSFFTGIDTKSEAIRDLKTSYYYSGDAGRYLFGGIEINNSNNMNDSMSSQDFYNVDVNCNGQAGDTVTGLNQKPIDNLIDFSSVIGRITGGTTDGVVDEPSSIMDTYYPTLQFPTKLFYFNSTFDFVENHTELPDKYYQIMQGLDEPNFKELAYGINTNQDYIGFTTVQNPVAADVDFYKFTVTNTMNASVSITNIATSTMTAVLLDATGTAVGTTQSNSGNAISFTRTIPAGDYFLKITSTNPTNTNYGTPYNFTVGTTLTTLDFDTDKIAFYPNPVKTILHIDTNTFEKAICYNNLGQKVFETQNNTLDFSGLNTGLYIIELIKNESKTYFKIIKE